MKQKIMAVIAILLMLGLLGGCASQEKAEEPQELTKVTVVLDWYPNTNHTGLYVAQELGYYQEQGLEVEIIQPSESGSDQLIGAGQGDFGVSYQEGVTQARAAGVPIVSIAAVIQHNTSCFASPAEKNIKSPADFEGKKYGGWGSPAEEAVLKSLMEKHQKDFSKLEMINIGSADFFSSVEKNVDFCWIFYGWDGVQAELKEMPLNVIMLKDEDPALDYYTPVLIANEKTLEEKPELARKFLAATQKGYEYCIAHPEESGQILLKNAPELDAALVQASQLWLADKYQDDAAQWGIQKAEVWSAYTDWLRQQGLLENEIDVDQAFTNEFLEQ